MDNLIQIMKSQIDLNTTSIKNIIALLNDGATIAFIARYRKDMTQNATDETLLKFQEIYEYTQKLIKRKDEILNILKEKNQLNDKIKLLILNATKLQTLEDIYEPYKGVKNSRANFAIENNLEPLANMISGVKYTKNEIEQKAKQFLNRNIKTIQNAIDGAKDIIALRYAQDIKTKDHLRQNLQNYAILTTKKTKTFDENGQYKNLKDISEKVKWLKSHKILAIFRAVNEKQISVKIEVDEEYLIYGIKKFRIPSYGASS